MIQFKQRRLFTVYQINLSSFCITMNIGDHQRENHVMVTLDRPYDSLYEEILPSTHTFSRNSTRTDKTDQSYAVYQKPKSSSNQPKRSWLIVVWTIVLVVTRWSFQKSCMLNEACTILICCEIQLVTLPER